MRAHREGRHRAGARLLNDADSWRCLTVGIQLVLESGVKKEARLNWGPKVKAFPEG
jgi:hypothetical protein